MKGKIFNAQEVQSIIAGNKRMFREVPMSPILKTVKLPKENCSESYFYVGNGYVKCPYQVGQNIFCKESFWEYNRFGDEFRYDYDADTDYTKCLPDGFPIQRIPLGAWQVNKLPAQHMKQEQSRLTLLIKEIRVERLADITLDDVIKEGTQIINGWDSPDVIFDKFQEKWNATHKKPEEKFEASPWVWSILFEVVK